VGDTAELSALQKVFGDRAAGSLHVGSVKAQIGHTMAAAGAAGLLKTVLGLDRKTLPPMPPVATPIAGVDDAGPFRLVTAAAPWPALANGEPRRAAVNSFGFGGTNWHVIVEEFVPAYHEALLASLAGRSMPRAETPVEAMAVQAATPSNVLVAAGTTSQELRAAVGRLDPVARRREGNGPWRIAFVAHSKTDFESKVDLISKHYRPGGRSPLLEANGIFATADQAIEVGPVAGLFPGQGPQYADMLRDLADEHDIVRRTVAEADDVLRELVGETYAQLMFTATRTAEERSALEQSLSARSDIVQPVLVTAGVALHRLATAHGVRFETLAGHSLGEYAALVSAGVLEFAQAVRVAHARGQAFRDLAARSGHAGLMATVAAGADVVAAALEGVRGYVTIANRNCPLQTVISGEDQPLRDALIRLEGQGIECRVLPIAGAFHSRLADAARARMQQAVAALTVRAPSTRVLSSVDLAYYEPSTDCGARVRSNLVEQLVTPVDFIGLVERLHADGVDRFIEIGPKNALTGFVDDILGDTRAHRSLFMNHPKIGEIPQLDRFVAQYALLDPPPAPQQTPRARELDRDVPSFASGRRPGRPALPSPDRIWITGVSIGLPGRTSRVFSDDGLERLLAGACFIEPISESLQDRMVAKRITRLVKSEDGEPYLADVTSRADVVKLAGQRGGFSLREDFGLEDESLENADIAYQLAVAAGFECLRDARIPLQRAYKRTSRGGSLRGGWMLPAAMQDDTAVVFASAFPGHNALYQELERYYASTYGAVAASTIRDQYLRRLQAAQTEDERLQADQWFVDQRRATNLDGHCGAYRFNRNFLADYSCMGNTRFAQLVRARGPNLAVNATCCSTAVALATAEDIIRCGRARRVVVLAADDVSSDVLFEWIGAGFLAAGAAATDSDVADAAIPFDRRRHGVIVGMGAVGFVVEAESAARERSLDPVAELLGVRVANSASHMTRPDAEHVVTEMKAFLADMEARHAVDSRGLASNVVYGSHETFTLPSGGIGAVEGRMLKQVFGDRWRDVVVVNTKCSTGHAQGASLADAILIKALQAGKVPPVLHSTDIDPDLAGINLSTGGTTDREYALGFSAGFGSQVAMWLTRVVTRAADRVTSEIGYRHWLEGITGIPNASVTVVKRMLLVDEASTTDIAGRPVAPAVTPVAAPRRELDTTPAPAPAGPAVGPPVPASVPAVSVPVRETVVAAPVPEAAGVQRAAHSEAAITAQVMTIIEEKTGYEREYLELDLDLEADLGVDTIKQAQVMARIRETFGLPKDKSIRVKDFPTLRHVVNYVQAKLDDGAIASQSVRIDAAPWQPPVVEGKSPVIGASPLGPSVVTAAESSEVAQIVPDGSASSQPAAEGNHADQRVLDVVLAIVEKLTGYEREALGQDLDLEADLGIDTIKQAQVMARIRDEFNLPREQGIRVKDFPTIRHVVGYITSRVAGPRVVAPAHRVETAGGARESRLESPMPAASAPRQLEGSLPSGIHRMAVRSSPHPPSDERPNAQLGADWTLLLTDDGLGVAEALSRMLFERGARVEILGQGQEIAAARARLGRVRGLVLLHPLATDPAVAALDAAAWREVLDRKVLASFQAVKTLQSDLEMVVGVTAMSGPYGWRGQLVDPAGSGVAGFLKALRQEADGVLVKVIDVERPAARAEAERLAAAILTEIEHGGTRVEVAYRDAVRLVPRVVRESLDLSAASQRKISADSVIVAIGGSRGVTAAVVKELARRYGPRLVLVGKQPLPAKVAQLAALDRDGLKQHKDSIARGWKTRVMGTKPIEIERKYAATLHAIEAFRTIQACEAAGSVVSYHACDVRDANGVREMVKSVVRQHGGIDGVIFGAGIIEDKLIEGKTLESFARVFGVKAEGMFNVYKALDGVSLSFLAAFSSVAGRFGNVGQGDYAAGNEVMTRLVSLMQAARPSTRCVAFDWTGWDEVGLAARSGVIELMKDSGFEALSPDQGARLFHEELIYGAGPEEIVIAGEHLPVDKDGQIDVAGHVVATTPERQHAGVFLGVVHSHEKGAWVSATTTIEPRVNGWLRDHVIDGAALLPAVFGIEMMAEAASLLFPDLHLWGVRDLQLHLAVKVLKDRATPLNVIAVGRTGDTDDERVVAVEVTSDFIGGDGRVLIANRVHYTCDVLLRSTPPVSAWRDDGRAARASVATAIPRLYGEGGALPHGPTFQVLERVDGMDADGIVASVAAVDESLVFPALNGHRLLTLPFAREAAFQAAGLWGIVRHENFGLPHGCRALHTFGAPPRGTKLLVRVVAKVVDIVRMEYDIDLIGDDGRLYDRMEGFYTVNPLAAAERAAHELGSETAE
jgi:malonyl CoA-acyl carrier protein transacylase/predicted hotdog family 3-hydroxylacyl-ACP dehydratase